MLTKAAYSAGMEAALEKFAVSASDYLRLSGRSILGGNVGEARDFLRQALQTRQKAPAPTGQRPAMPAGGFQTPHISADEARHQVTRAADAFIAQRTAYPPVPREPIAVGPSGLPMITAQPVGGGTRVDRPAPGGGGTGVLRAPAGTGPQMLDPTVVAAEPMDKTYVRPAPNISENKTFVGKVSPEGQTFVGNVPAEGQTQLFKQPGKPLAR